MNKDNNSNSNSSILASAVAIGLVVAIFVTWFALQDALRAIGIVFNAVP